jgi:hypothetical protein
MDSTPAPEEAKSQPASTSKLGRWAIGFDKTVRLSQWLSLALCSIAFFAVSWTAWHTFDFDLDMPTVLFIVAAVAALLIWFVPKVQVSRICFDSKSAKFSAENEARRTIATVAGGVAILIGFYTAQQQLSVQQQVQFTERYTKAIDQIASADNEGKPRLAVRVGGLYVLEQIMDSSQAQHDSIIEVLCAYIRDNSVQDLLKPPGGIRNDIRVALTILGRRNRDLEISTERKRGFRLLKALVEDRHFLDVFTVEHLQPRLDLSNSDLSRADLSHLILPNADFSNTKLQNCTALFANLDGVNFTGSDLSNCLMASSMDGADFSGSNLQGTVLSGKISHIRLSDANLELSIWIGAKLEFPREVQTARNWQLAFYRPEDLEILGLPPDHNKQLIQKIHSNLIAATIDRRIKLTAVLSALQQLPYISQDLRNAIVGPLTTPEK